ncbi:hypothetical protein C8R43DRAFT_893166 [Mycena crocata]|nr:hypothetical protein C8R43DRAFT_893166 [Mycena crocata]
MHFLAQQRWPTDLNQLFVSAKSQSDAGNDMENRYYGAYTMMLTHCFGPGYRFMVAPQYAPQVHSHETIDFIMVIYIVVCHIDHERPVLILEIKDDKHIKFASRRQLVDAQMCHRYDELLDRCPIDVLHGISVIGTKMRCYTGDKWSGIVNLPVVIPHHSRSLPTTYLLNDWDTDIMSEAGFQQMQSIVKYIADAVFKMKPHDPTELITRE